VILARTGPYAGELAIDLGFSNYVRLAEVIEDVSPLKEGEIIEFSDEQDEVRSSAESRLFTYRAWVHRVLDGDTIEAVVDLGFGITTTQILRLRGIDAPELVSKEGKEAKEALEKMLKLQDVGGRMADGETGGPVLIKTVKSDKYDRYLADVFLPGAEGQEVYLNNLLLEKELAVRAQG
jgi:endonuclease YncB( thermonuclease family)